MIWVWIGLAFLLSKLALRKKRISPEHYVWMLLPIDMYGLNVAGVTLKPYMLFSVFLVWLIWKRRDSRLVFQFDRTWAMSAMLLLILMLGVNLFNSNSTGPAMSTLMVMLVFACAIIYISAIEPGTVRQISDVVIATAIGYGIVFLIGTYCYQNVIRFGGIYSADRMGQGMFLRFDNMVDGYFTITARLRGFTIDPNVLVCNFIYAIPAAFMKLAEKQDRGTSILSLFVGFACIFICNSRMGILCAVAVAFIAAFFSYRAMTGTAQKWMIGFLTVAIVALVAVGIFTDKITTFFVDLVERYEDRSGLTDEYGRFTLWRSAIDVLLEKNPLFGVGFNMVKEFTSTEKECHNTWLEWMCSSGLLVGSGVCIYFVCALTCGFARIKYYWNSELRTVYLALMLGVVGTVFALMSVDNVTNSYLWYGIIALTAMWTRFRPDKADGGNQDALAGTS